MQRYRIIKFFILLLDTILCSLLALVFYWARYINWNIDYYLMQSWCNFATFIYGIKRIRIFSPNYIEQVGIYISPHSTFWDILIMGSEVRGFFVSKAEVVKWPVVGIGAKLVRTVFIKREAGVTALNAMGKAAIKIFETGNSLIVFPEGTRSIEHMQPLKSGAFHISFQTGRPIIPVILKYKPAELLVGNNTKVNFIVQMLKQAMYLNKGSAVYIKKLEPVFPKKFKTVADMRDHVQAVMNDEYSRLIP